MLIEPFEFFRQLFLDVDIKILQQKERKQVLPDERLERLEAPLRRDVHELVAVVVVDEEVR